MADKPLPCRHAGCRGIVRDGRCSLCGPQPNRIDHRRNSRDRGYTRQWNKIAEIHKTCSPLCALCEAEGRVTVATKSHHLDRVSEGHAVIVGQSDLLAVCDSCHQRVEGLGRNWMQAIRSNRSASVNLRPTR